MSAELYQAAAQALEWEQFAEEQAAAAGGDAVGLRIG